MRLKAEEKFILPDDDGNLILITEIDFDYSILQNRVILMKGVKLEIDYDNNNVSSCKEVEVQTNFTFDGVYDKEN